MASVGATGAIISVEETIGNLPRVPPAVRHRRVRWWRLVVLLLAGAYFLLPIYAGLKFSFEDIYGKFSFQAVKNLPTAPGFPAAFWLSLRLGLLTVIASALLLVPTSIYVHLRLPRLRRLLEFVTILPIVIPPIILILGVLGSAPLWARSSPYLLSFEYVILSMPFVYRSLDSGLSAIDLKTLVEASRSLGGTWVKTIWRVIVPNLRPALLSAMVLTLALVLGEYTMALLDGWITIPVWIAEFNTAADGHIQVAASMIGLVGTWIILTLIVLLDRSGSRRFRRRAGSK